MSKKSKEWDKREKRNLLGNPFNIKLIVFLGIVVLAVSLFMAFIFPPIYAGEDNAHCKSAWESHASCHNTIIEQNRQIIEKLDWSNCAESFQIIIRHYGEDLQTHDNLVNSCGERP